MDKLKERASQATEITMEKIFVVTMLLLVSCSNSLAQDHNVNANNTEGYNPCDGIHELFPDPEDCGKFYHCDGLTPYHKDCPAELEWSVARKRCEWPWIAGCSGTPTSRPGPRPTRQPGPSTTSSEGPQPAPTSRPAPGYNPCDGIHEFFPDPADCSKFYHCDGLTPYHKDCPAGLDWSVKRNRCEWPWIAGCSGSPTPKPRPKPTGQPEPSPGYNPCDGVHEFFPDPEDCSKFYHCNGFIPYHMDCPAGLDWSVKRNRCEWPRIAGCSGSSTPQPRPRTTGQPEPSPTSSKGPQPTSTSGLDPTPITTGQPEPSPTSSKGTQPTPTTGPQPTSTSDLDPTSIASGQPEPPPTSSKGPQPTPTIGPQPASSEGPQPSPTSTPAYNPCDGVHEFFPDPEDCGKFYQCNGFIPYHMSCPAGLEWSVTRNRCEWPWNAGCSGSSTLQPRPRPTGQPGPLPTSSDGPKPVPTLEPRYNPCDGVHEYFPDPEDCGKFYQCNGFIPYHMDCPAGLEWSVTRNRCEWPWIAGCSGSSTLQPRPRPTGQPGPLPTSSDGPKPVPTLEPRYNPCDGVHEYFPDPEDCGKFYQCNGFIPYHMDCPAGLEWSVTRNRCEWPWIAGCSGSSTLQPRPRPTGQPGPLPTSSDGPKPVPTLEPRYNPCDGVHEYFPDPEDCGKFYQCNGFIPYHMDCPAGLEWSVTRNRCEWPWIAGCSGSSTLQPRPRPTGQPGPLPTSSDGPKPVPTLEPRYNPCDGVHEYFPDPEDCGKFYQCNGFIPYHMDCPAGLEWSVTRNRCEWPWIAGCSGSSTLQPRPRPTGQPGPLPTSSDGPKPVPTLEPRYNPCDGVHEYFPDPEDCGKFYQCNGFIPYHMDCPAGLEWSVARNRCEWPWIAGCSGSSTLQPRPRPTGQPGPLPTSSDGPKPVPTLEPRYNPCDGVHEYFPDPEDCGKFYQCNGFIPYHMDCPALLEWSVTRNRCEWPWIAGCSGSSTLQPRPRPTGQPGPLPTSSDGPKPVPTLEPRYNPCDGVHEFFPDPEDCSKFYHCDGFIGYHKDCPSGLEWSVRRNRCEWPFIAGCSA